MSIEARLRRLEVEAARADALVGADRMVFYFPHKANDPNREWRSTPLTSLCDFVLYDPTNQDHVRRAGIALDSPAAG